MEIIDQFLLPLYEAGLEGSGLSEDTFSLLADRFAPTPSPESPMGDPVVAPPPAVPPPAPIVAPPDPFAATPEDMAALAQVESGGLPDPNAAVSSAGAIGKYQMLRPTMEEVARGMGIDPTTVDMNNEEQMAPIAAKYLSDLNRNFKSKDLGFAAYHAGPGNVEKAIKATGSTDPEVIEQYWAQNGMPNSAAYRKKILAASNDASGVGALKSAMGDEQVAALDEMAAIDEGNRQAQNYANQIELEAQAKIDAQNQYFESMERQKIVARDALEQAITDRITNSQTDQFRVFKNMSTGEKIGLVLAAAASGFAAGFTGQEDKFMKYLSDVIDRDVRSQEQEILARDRKLEISAGVYRELLDKTGSPEAARAGAAAIGLEAARRQAEIMAGVAKDNVKRANLSARIAQIKQAQIQKVAEYENTAASNPQTVQAWFMKANALQGEPTADTELAGMPSKMQENYVRNIGFVGNSPDKKDVVEKTAAVEDINNIIDSAIKWREKAGFLDRIDPTQVLPLISGVREALLKIKDQYGLGALQRFERALIGEVMPQDISSHEWATKALFAIGLRKNASAILPTLIEVRDRVNESYWKDMDNRVNLQFDVFKKKRQAWEQGVTNRTATVPQRPAREAPAPRRVEPLKMETESGPVGSSIRNGKQLLG